MQKVGVSQRCEECDHCWVCWDGTQICPECKHYNGPNVRISQRTWPMKSEALGVQPGQIDAAKAEAAKMGIPTDFTPDGRAIFTSPKHFKRYAEAHGYYAKNGGYSDPQRGASKGKWF